MWATIILSVKSEFFKHHLSPVSHICDASVSLSNCARRAYQGDLIGKINRNDRSCDGRSLPGTDHGGESVKEVPFSQFPKQITGRFESLKRIYHSFTNVSV